MAEKEIVTFGSPLLNTPAEEVKEIDGKIIKLVQNLKDTLAKSERGIGLAANQIGVLKRIFVYHIEDLDEEGVVINPEIVQSEGEWLYQEGCLSVPGFHFPIVRPKTVLLKGIDLNGNPFERQADELLARLFQHEVDHLNGKLLLTKVSDEQRREFYSSYVLGINQQQSVKQANDLSSDSQTS
jgi:peptide deformylase